MAPKPEPRRPSPDVLPDSLPKERGSDVLPDDPRRRDPRGSDVTPDSVTPKGDDEDPRVNAGT